MMGMLLYEAYAALCCIGVCAVFYAGHAALGVYWYVGPWSMLHLR